MKLPSLPLINVEPELQEYYGGKTAFLIDNSTLELLRCPRLYEYKGLRKREYTGTKAGANFGSTLHVGWAVRYRRCGSNPVGPEDAVAINETMAKWVGENPQPLDDFRDYNHACVVMAAYNNHYTSEGFKIVTVKKALDNKVLIEEPLVEKSFALLFGRIGDHAIIYTGKIDLGIYDNHGLWSQDHKTAFMFGDAFDAQMQMDGGQLGYCWALFKATGVMPRGYIIDAVRIRKPSRKSEYDQTAPVDASDFKRMPFFITDDTIEEWKEDVNHLIKTIFYHHGMGYFPRHRWHCVGKYGKCEMFDVCSVGRESREAVLTGTLYEDYLWSPLNIPQIKTV